MPQADLRFNGAGYDPARDNARLITQMERIFNFMRDGQWRTLDWISTCTGDPQTSISAQLRHLRKLRFGGHTVSRRHVGDGLFEYRLEVAE